MFEPLIEAIRLQPISGAIPVPNGIRLIPEEAFADSPISNRASLVAESISSLVAYADDYANEDSAIFASRKLANVVLIVDYLDHSGGNMNWAEHSIVLPLQFTEDWLAWSLISGKKMAQAAFAEFIEEHLDTIHSPSAAEVLTIATTLSGKRNIKWNSAVRLQNGDTQLTYEEETVAKAAGDVKVPSEIVLRIPVYRGAEKATTFEVKALLRYRMEEGRLHFEVKLQGADKVADLAFDEVISALRSDLSAAEVTAPIYLGHVAKTPRTILNERSK